MEYKTLQTNFERELLFQIIQNIKRKKLTKKNAKKVAKKNSVKNLFIVFEFYQLVNTSNTLLQKFMKIL